MTSPSRPTVGRLLAFAAPSLPLAGFGLPLVVHLPAYYSRDIGLPLAAVGLAFMAVRLLDIAFDPVLGVLMDRTRTRLGRFRPWLIASVPVMGLAAALLFMARPGVSVTYLWIGLLIAYLGFSMGSLSQTAWGATLSTDYDQRSRIYGWWQAGNILGMLLILLLPPILELGFGLPRSAGVFAMGVFIVVSLPLTVASAVWRVGEPQILGAGHGRMRDYFGLFKIASVRKLLIADLLLGWAPGLTAALFFFYFASVKGIAPAQANLLLLAYFMAGLIGAPIWPWLAARLGKPKALAVAAAMMAVVQVMLAAVPHGGLFAAIAVVALAGLPFSGGAILLRSMLADVGDEVRLETRQDFTGILYSVLTGTRKVADALAVGAGLIVLELVGFQPRAAVNSPEALRGLEIMFVALPALVALGAAWLIYRFPVDARRHQEILAELARRDGAAT